MNRDPPPAVPGERRSKQGFTLWKIPEITANVSVATSHAAKHAIPSTLTPRRYDNFTNTSSLR